MAPAPAARQAPRRTSGPFLGESMPNEQQPVAEPFAERHYTVNELASIWRLSGEFVRQLVQHELGVTEWVRQQPGRRRYRVLRIPQSVAARVYRRALSKARAESTDRS